MRLRPLNSQYLNAVSSTTGTVDTNSATAGCCTRARSPVSSRAAGQFSRIWELVSAHGVGKLTCGLQPCVRSERVRTRGTAIGTRWLWHRPSLQRHSICAGNTLRSNQMTSAAHSTQPDAKQVYLAVGAESQTNRNRTKRTNTSTVWWVGNKTQKTHRHFDGVVVREQLERGGPALLTVVPHQHVRSEDENERLAGLAHALHARAVSYYCKVSSRQAGAA